jgi:O-antigen/teichoic acid export membrane protein
LKRKFLTNLILLLFLNLLIKPVWLLGFDRLVQNKVGDQDFGLYFSLFSFSMLLNILLDVGITNYNNRNISQHNFLLNKHFSHIVGLKLLLAIVYSIFVLVAAAIIGYDKLQFHLLFFLIFNQFLISFTLYLRSNISALHLFKTDSLLSVLDRTIMIVLCSLLLYSNITGIQFTIEWFVYVQTAAYLVTMLVALLIVLHKTGKIRIDFSSNFHIVILKKSYPYALLILLMSFYNRIDSVLIERLLPDNIGKEQAGIYAQAFRLLDAISMFGALFAGLLLPIFSKMLKNREDIGPMVKLAYTLLILPAIGIATLSMFYNEELMGLLYNSNTNYSSAIIGVLLTGNIGIATTYLFGTLLTANGSIRQLNIIAFFGMILNVSLNLFLIPRFMAHGAAYSSLVTQIATGTAQLILALYIFKLKPGSKYIIQLLTFAGGVLVFGLFSRAISNWVVGCFVMITLSVALSYFLKLLNISGLFKLLLYRNDEESNH